jgi:ribonuclease HII
MPTLDLELSLGGRVAGIDEAGRGPWAGPVVAAVAILDTTRLPASLANRLDDSKKLARPIREDLFEPIHDYAEIGVGIAETLEIDRINILRATLLAMQRAVSALAAPPAFALIDGNVAPKLCCPTHTVVQGDGLCLSIAAASIVAKVTRDRLMAKLAVEHPGYGWEHNVGYGTPEHRSAIERLGITPHHRRSFAPIAIYCK